MVFTHVSPIWFYGYDIALELIMATTSLLVSLVAFKISKKTEQNSVRLLGIAFLLISMSYFIQSILNFLIISRLNEHICECLKLHSVNILTEIGLLVHMIFMTLGLSLLCYATLFQRSVKSYILILSLSFLAILLAKDILFSFYVFATLFLLFLLYHSLHNCIRHRNVKTTLIALAFSFLLFGNVHYLIAVNHSIFYVIGHILESIAYLLILTNLYLVLKK